MSGWFTQNGIGAGGLQAGGGGFNERGPVQSATTPLGTPPESAPLTGAFPVTGSSQTPTPTTGPGSFTRGNGPALTPQQLGTLSPDVYAQVQQNPSMAGLSAAPGPQQSTGSVPQFTSGMSDDQVRAAANQYISAAGLPNTDNGQYWVNLYHQEGNDPNFFTTRLLNGINQNGGNMSAFGAPDPTKPGGWGPGTSGSAPESGGGGTSALGAPKAPTFTPFQAPAAFQAPTMAQAEQEPGYQFALTQGVNALENSATARGETFSPNTSVGIQNYGQQAAQQNYGNVYNRALGQYQQNYQNAFNTWSGNNQGALGNYQAQVQAGLGYGQLALGQGYFGLAGNQQQFGQGLALNQNAWNQNFGLAQLGNPGAPNYAQYGQGQGNIYQGIGNTTAGSQIAQGNISGNLYNNLGNYTQYGLSQYQRPTDTFTSSATGSLG